MPDSDWSVLEGVEHQRYEEAYQRGEAPDPDFGLKSHRESTVQGERTRSTFIIDVWEDIEMEGTGTPVYEFCSGCGGHFHQVDGDVPAADQDHVLASRWGDRRGMKYNAVHVTGVQIERMSVEHVTTAPPDPVILDLPDSTTIFWSIRNIDHYLDGIIWDEWHTLPCAERGGYYVGIQRATDLFVAALGVVFKDVRESPRIVANDFVDLLLAVCRLKRPSIAIERGRHGWDVRVTDDRQSVAYGEPIRLDVKDGHVLRLRA